MNRHHSEGGALLLALGSEDGAARHNAPCPRSHSRTQRRAHRGSEAHPRQIRRRKKLKSTTKKHHKNKQAKPKKHPSEDVEDVPLLLALGSKDGAGWHGAQWCEENMDATH